VELFERQFRAPTRKFAQCVTLYDFRKGAVDRLGRSPSGKDLSSLRDEVEVEVERGSFDHDSVCIELPSKAYKFGTTSIPRPK